MTTTIRTTEALGERIRLERKAQGLRQPDLAAAAQRAEAFRGFDSVASVSSASDLLPAGGGERAPARQEMRGRTCAWHARTPAVARRGSLCSARLSERRIRRCGSSTGSGR